MHILQAPVFISKLDLCVGAMSKKSRGSKAKRRTKSVRTTTGERSQSPKPAVVGYQLPTQKPSEARGPIDHYQYVLPELRRIGIIAGSILLVLIVLSFVFG